MPPQEQGLTLRGYSVNVSGCLSVGDVAMSCTIEPLDTFDETVRLQIGLRPACRATAGTTTKSYTTENQFLG